jgi:hypothetical protein
MKKLWRVAFALTVVLAGLGTALWVGCRMLNEDTVGGVLAFLDAHSGCRR